MEKDVNPAIDKYKDLLTQREQLEQALATAKVEIHEASLGALGSDGNQPLDQQAERIMDYTQFHHMDAPWFYATLNSIMRARMSHPALCINREFKVNMADDPFKLSTNYNLTRALAYAYHRDYIDFPSGIPEAIKILELGYQSADKSERAGKFQYHPKRSSIVFQWLGENINTIASFGELSFEQRKKYLSDEDLAQFRNFY